MSRRAPRSGQAPARDLPPAVAAHRVLPKPSLLVRHAFGRAAAQETSDREQIEALKLNHRYAVLDVRGDLQALDVEELKALLERGDAFFEGNPFVGRVLQTHPLLADVQRLSIFMSPLSKDEIVYLKAPERNISLEDFLTDLMRRKLLRRTRRQQGELSLKQLENIETQASSAYHELKEAWYFQYVIPNHDGEDSDNWEALYYQIGDARTSLHAVVALLEGAVPPVIEKWEEDVFQSGA